MTITPKTQQETSQASGEENNSLPSDATASPPTSATGTVTEHQSTGGNSAPTEPENVKSDADAGRVQSSSSQMTDEGGKEFYTITTKGDKVFYLVIDKDKTDENVYLLTEVGENDLLNFTDGNTVTLPQNQAVVENALPIDKAEMTEEGKETEKEKDKEKEPEKEPEKQNSNTGTFLLMGLVLAAVGGGYYYMKFVRGKNHSFDADYDEDEDEEEPEPGMEEYEETSEEDEPDGEAYEEEEDEPYDEEDYS